jgi:hypothetical protein
MAIKAVYVCLWFILNKVLILYMKDSGVDFSNLKNDLDFIKSKFEQLGGFKLLLLGVIFGAFISVPVQLLIAPLTYVGNSIKYNGETLVSNVSTIQYVLVIGAIIVIGVIIIWRIYKANVLGIKQERDVTITYDGDYREIYNRFREFLFTECRFSPAFYVQADDPDYKEIHIHREVEGPFASDDLDILEIVFNPGLIRIKYNPGDEDSQKLLKRILSEKEQFSNSSKK